MVGFEYVGKSTATIIDTPLILVSTGQEDSIVGSARSKVEGEITISRPVTNEYGTTHDPLSFTYSLMKMDGETFTREEQVAIERWLSSPKLSSELKITDCEDNTYLYYGLFTNTEWVIGNGDYMLCTFTFQVNGRHCYKEYKETFDAGNWEVNEETGEKTLISSNGMILFDINNETDELEEYVYPKIEVKALQIDGANNGFTFINNTDKGNRIRVISRRAGSSTIFIDAKNCMIGEYADGIHNRLDFDLLRFSDVGLQDVDNVYWPRLLPGKNEIIVYGNVEITVSFCYPYKKVGGWLI